MAASEESFVFVLFRQGEGAGVCRTCAGFSPSPGFPNTEQRLVQCSVKLHQVVHCSVFMGCNFVRHKPLSKVGLLYSDAGMHS